MPDIRTALIKDLGRKDYASVWHDMQKFTLERDETTLDELWLVEHSPVFTQGQAGKAEHLLNPGDIPVVQVDRGGQVTYHGPGQMVAYVLLEMHRFGSDVRKLVSAMETSIVKLLAEFGIESAPRADAPGVYVVDEKICSLGLRIKKGRSFHGLALNVDMNLEPFSRINPCGYEGMVMTQVANYVESPDMTEMKSLWVRCFTEVMHLRPEWGVQA